MLNNPEPLISLAPDKCNNCLACVRVCPTDALVVRPNHEHVEIVNERCIGCGSCVLACQPGAITYRSSVGFVRDLLNGSGKKAAIVDPSIAPEFDDITDYRKFVRMIKSLGFDYVFEASFGVDLVAAEYADLFNDFKGKYYLLTCCPPLVSYIQKFYPGLVDNLAPIVSPMTASTKVVRKLLGSDAKVVYIGSCIARKDEAGWFTADARTDEVLTFQELRILFKEKNISETSLEYADFDQPFGNKGSLFPISYGLLQAANIEEDLVKGSVTTSEGRRDFEKSVREFAKNIELIRHHFNIFYCDGCMMGPGMKKGGEKFLRHSLVTEYAGKRIQQLDAVQWKKDIDIYSELDFSRKFETEDRRLAMPSEDKIREILKILGKENIQEDEIGCSSCGYNNCRDFAIAVARGIAKTDMCLSFAVRNRNEYIRNLKTNNEKLLRGQETLQKFEKESKQKLIDLEEVVDRNGAIIQNLKVGIVVVDENLRIVDSNKKFIDLLGDEARMIDEVIPGLTGADLKTLVPAQLFNLFSYVLTDDEDYTSKDIAVENSLLNATVFSIKKNKLAGGILRDLFTAEVRSEEIIERVNDVIDTNLELVQKIAFLLGESASKTEKMLNSIIEVYKLKQNEPGK